MHTTASARALAWLCVPLVSFLLFFAGARLGAEPSPVSESRLATAVDGFLSRWLVERYPLKAVNLYFTTRLKDKRFAPAEVYDAADYHEDVLQKQGDELPMLWPNEKLARSMEKLLLSILSEMSIGFDSNRDLSDILAPISSDADPEVWDILSEHPISTLKEGLVFSIPVKDWTDISWTASPTIGHQFALGHLIKDQELDMHGVLFRIRQEPDSNDSLLCMMLWADESPAREGDWKFWALIPARTE